MLATTFLAVTWVGVSAYVLFGGADFGAGVWDLLAGGAESGAAQRARIEHSIGPIWEANHVWLIFVLVMLWTGFPSVFAALASTLYIPITLIALGIIARGAGFAFRKVSTQLRFRRAYGATFALASLLTPFFLGTTAGAVATGRVPPGIAAGDVVTSWANPTSLVTGALAVALFAYLAATYLCRDAQRAGEHDLAEHFRRRALGAGVTVGALALVGLVVLRLQAASLYAELTRWPALGGVAVSILAGVVSLVLLWRRAFLAVRLSASLAVVGLLWGWAAGQFPVLLPGVDVAAAAATPAVLRVSLVALGVGALLLVPSLVWLYRIFQAQEAAPGS